MAIRVLSGILGALIAIAGVWCLITPGLSGMQLAWVVGAIMLFDGISGIFSYMSLRKIGRANGWSLVSTILSLVCGLVILFSGTAQVLLDFVLAYLVAAWFIINGVLRIVLSFQMRTLRKEVAPEAPSMGIFSTMLILGILEILIGILCLFNPMIVFATIGMLVGIGALFLGAALIVQALR